jgi:branched-chain amino acid transport system ATP-binding protein
VSLDVSPRERVALIGPNGAGKTSMLNAACGVVRPASGRVRIERRDVTGAPPAAVVRKGSARCRGRHVFSSLQWRRNLCSAPTAVFRLEFVSSTLRYLRSRRDVRARLERVTPPPAAELRERPAGRPRGEQRWPIGRALMARPRLLAIDEPRSDSPVVVQQLSEFLLRLNEEEGVAICSWTERVARVLACERAYVLEAGRVALEDRAAISRRVEVRSAYLGGGLRRHDDVLPARRHRYLDRLRLRHRRDVARPGLPGDGIVNFAQGARRPRRPPHHS